MRNLPANLCGSSEQSSCSGRLLVVTICFVEIATSTADAARAMETGKGASLMLSVSDLRRSPGTLRAKAEEVKAELQHISLEQSGVHIAAYTADQAMSTSV